MRTVSGAPAKVVVVGGGLGGLSCALRLAGAGREVIVLEREREPGGRAGILRDAGYAFDTGPTVLTMPDLIADALACVGEELEDWLTLRRLDPVYRACFADGTQLNVRAEPNTMAHEIGALCGPREAAGYRRFADFVTQLYRLQIDHFIDRNLDSPFSLLTPRLAHLAAIGGFRRLAPKVRQYFRDPRLQRIFSFQSMYAGVSPQEALALFCVIAYMDTISGVYFPEGGMHAVPRALAGAGRKHGVVFRYGVEVTSIERAGSRAVAAHTADGERITGDVFVLNPDLPVARRDLLGDPLRRRPRFSPSCYLLLAGSRSSYHQAEHHNIHFGRAWQEVFRELADGRLMKDPSFLVSVPTRSDPSLAPAGRQIHSVLFPAPNLDGDLDWSRIAAGYHDRVVETLEARGYPGFGNSIEVSHTTTPLDWQRRGMEAGTPFAAAHTFRQTGPFRCRNLWGDNVVFAGSGTQPGVGVPMVLISGQLASERILGTTR